MPGNATGDLTCLSGAVTGIKCGAKVNGSGYAQYQFGWRRYVKAEQVDGNVIVGGGDSGGPAFSLHPTSGVIAKGIISSTGSNPRTDCNNYWGGGLRPCSSRVEYADINGVTSNFPGLTWTPR